jgi:signal peptidase I
MSKLVPLKSSDFFPLINMVFANGQTARITVTGQSMFPFLREGVDSVELSPVDYQGIFKGDIVLVQRDNGEYVLHRVIRKCFDVFYILGDGQIIIEGPIRSRRLLAKVKTVWRHERKIDCSRRTWRFLSQVWVYAFPFRRVFIKMHTLLKRIV